MPDPREAWRLTDAEIEIAVKERFTGVKLVLVTETSRAIADAASKKALRWAAQQCEQIGERGYSMSYQAQKGGESACKKCAAAIRGAL